MGFDLTLFISQPDPELICPICQGVLEDPVADECQHLYCQSCLEEWRRVKNICPFTRQPIGTSRPVPLALHNIIDALRVKCPLSETNGCDGSIALIKYPEPCSQCYEAQGSEGQEVTRLTRQRFVGREADSTDSIISNEIKYTLGGIAVAGACGVLIAFDPGLGIRVIGLVRTVGITAVGCAVVTGIEMALARIRRN